MSISPITRDPSIIALVIQDYLNGISRDQTAKRRRISAGSVSNIISNWKQQMQNSNVEEIRSFSKIVFKSNISVYQCARGYRMERILNNLGVYDDHDIFEHEHEIEQNYDDRQEYMYNDNWKEDKYIISKEKNNNVKKAMKQDITFFVNEIYRNCIKYDILPSIVPCWIKDLIDIFNESDSCIQNNIINTSNHIADNNNNKEDENIYPDLDYIQSNNNISTTNNSRCNHQQNQKQQNSILRYNSNIKRVPFISRISNFISQSKKEYFNLEDDKKKLKEEIKSLQIQKIQAERKLYQTNQREKKVIHYVDFFDSLKKELWEKYSIHFEDYIESFAKIINDFKKNGFDNSKIMLEYITSISIADKIEINDHQLNELEQRKKWLTESVSYLQNEINTHSQIVSTYTHLQEIGFGLHRLKQLYNIIIEVTEENNMSSHKEALIKFFADIEKEYDNKLGFELKVKEKKDELVLSNNQLNSNRAILQMQPVVGAALSSLFQRGITEQEIIKINQMVNEFEKEEDESNAKDENINNSSNISLKYKKTSLYQEVTDNIKNYKEIKAKIKNMKEIYKILQTKVSDLYIQNKELSEICKNTTLISNSTEGKLSLHKELEDHFNKEIDKKVKSISKQPIAAAVLLPIFIIIDKNTKKREIKDENNDK